MVNSSNMDAPRKSGSIFRTHLVLPIGRHQPNRIRLALLGVVPRKRLVSMPNLAAKAAYKKEQLVSQVQVGSSRFLGK